MDQTHQLMPNNNFQMHDQSKPRCNTRRFGTEYWIIVDDRNCRDKSKSTIDTKIESYIDIIWTTCKLACVISVIVSLHAIYQMIDCLSMLKIAIFDSFLKISIVCIKTDVIFADVYVTTIEMKPFATCMFDNVIMIGLVQCDHAHMDKHININTFYINNIFIKSTFDDLGLLFALSVLILMKLLCIFSLECIIHQLDCELFCSIILQNCLFLFIYSNFINNDKIIHFNT